MICIPLWIKTGALPPTPELRASGVPEEQAKARAKALSAVAREQLVTQSYFGARLKEREYRLITRLGGIMIAGFSALAVLEAALSTMYTVGVI